MFFTKYLTEEEIYDIETKLLKEYAENIKFVKKVLGDDCVEIFAVNESCDMKVKSADELDLYVRITENAEIYYNTTLVSLSEAYSTLHQRAIINENIDKMEKSGYKYLGREHSKDYGSTVYVFLSPNGVRETWAAQNMFNFLK